MDARGIGQLQTAHTTRVFVSICPAPLSSHTLGIQLHGSVAYSQPVEEKTRVEMIPALIDNILREEALFQLVSLRVEFDPKMLCL